MVAVLAPLLPLAWVAAYAAVRRARRGDVPDWRGAFTPLRSLARLLPRREQFASPLSAQTWCEWRQHGWSLPVLVAFVLPFALGLPFLDPESSSWLIISLAVVALTPPIMASFVASTVQKSEPARKRRRLRTGAIPGDAPDDERGARRRQIAREYRKHPHHLAAGARRRPVGAQPGRTPGRWSSTTRAACAIIIGLPRAVALGLLMLLALIGTTWKRLVTSLYIGLSGRPWLVRTNIGATFVLLVAAIPFVQWTLENRWALVRVIDAVPAVAVVLVVMKMSAAAWIVTRLDHARLIEPRALVTGAAVWLAAVLALYALLAWIARHAAHSAVCRGAHRHPGDPADALVRGAACPRARIGTGDGHDDGTRQEDDRRGADPDQRADGDRRRRGASRTTATTGTTARSSRLARNGNTSFTCRRVTTPRSRRRSSSACMAPDCGRLRTWR